MENFSPETCNIIARCIAKQSTKSNDWRQTGKVEKKGRGHCLQCECILVIGPVPGEFPFDVVAQSTEQSAIGNQR